MMSIGSRRYLIIAVGVVLGAVGLARSMTPGVAQDELVPTAEGSDEIVEGTVTEIVNVPGYTYVQVETVDGSVWVASPGVVVEEGDTVAFSTSMPMQDFYSKTLDREFSVLYFVDRFVSEGAITPIDREAAAAHGRMVENAAARPVEGITRADPGHTIAEIYASTDELQGREVRVRGQVVKFTPSVLGTNWVRIRDSSAANDLVVPTDEVCAINDIVLAEGRIELNKDLGQGFVIPVVLEEATITIE